MPLTARKPDALAFVYAQSLFELAMADGGQSRVESILGQLEDILDLASGDRAFSEILASHVIATPQRHASLQRIFAGRIDDLALRFLLLLNEKGRLSHLPTIIAAFDHVVQERFGRVEVDVFTADPISPDAVRGIRERLGHALRKEVVVHPYTDPQMIGGVRFRIGDQLVDASVATRLRRLRDQLDNQGLAQLRGQVGRIIEG